MRAWPHNSNDCHHSPAGHPSGSKDTNSGGGATVNGGRRCLAISGSPTSQVSDLPVRQMAPPPTLSSPPSMPLAQTHPRLLTLIRQSQRIDQPAQQQTMILDDLQQRIRPRLPGIASNHKRRATQLRLKGRDFITRTARLTQNLKLAGIQ